MFERREFDDFYITYTEVIDGVEVKARRSRDFTSFEYPDGTTSMQHDDGRVIIMGADGSMTVVDPADNYSSYLSPEQLAVDAAFVEARLRDAGDGEQTSTEF